MTDFFYDAVGGEFSDFEFIQFVCVLRLSLCWFGLWFLKRSFILWYLPGLWQFMDYFGLWYVAMDILVNGCGMNECYVNHYMLLCSCYSMLILSIT